MSGSSKDDCGGVPPQNKGSWATFLRSIANFNGDLSSMTAPPFILGTTSLTEFSAYWAEHPDILVAPASEPDPAKRSLLVLKWFLSTLKSSYSTRSDKYGSEKKPLNPFLGELFLGKWEDKAGTTKLVSEQVSHHPPVTAYCIWNDKHGVKLQGYNAQKVTFSRTIHIKQIGHALLSLTPPSSSSDSTSKIEPEHYLITLPSLHIEGLIYGKPFVELNSCTYISSSTGYVSKIDYSGKGWLSGKKNTFSASVYPAGKEKEVLYTAEGQWTDSFTIKSGGGGTGPKAKLKSETLDTYNAKTTPTTPIITAPLDQQDPYESNRAWQHVAAAIEKGNMDVVHVEKSKIENAQREFRKKEAAEGKEWQRKFFKRSQPPYEIFERLSRQVPGLDGIGAEKTGGVWRFDEETGGELEKAKGVKGLNPAGG